MENIKDVIKDCFIDLIDDGYLVSLYDDNVLKIGTNIFRKASDVINFCKKIMSQY